MFKTKIKKQLSKNLLSLFFLISILILPFFVFATGTEIPSVSDRLTNVSEAYNTSSDKSLFDLINSAINIFLSLLGVIFVILMLYAGYLWMTASGNDSKVETAQKIITRSIIGLIVTIGSFAIWKFVSYIL